MCLYIDMDQRNEHPWGNFLCFIDTLGRSILSILAFLHRPCDRRQGEERHRFRYRRRLVRVDPSRARRRDRPVNRGVEIGVDLGGVQPIVLSNGTVIDLPRTTTADRKRLADAQRVVERRQKGSPNRLKAAAQGGQFQAGYARRRKDAVHKATTIIVKNHGVIVIEPECHSDDQKRQRHGGQSGQTRAAAGELEPFAARSVATDDLEHAGVQGGVVRRPDRRRRSGADRAVLQRLRYRRRSEPHSIFDAA